MTWWHLGQNVVGTLPPNRAVHFASPALAHARAATTRGRASSELQLRARVALAELRQRVVQIERTIETCLTQLA